MKTWKIGYNRFITTNFGDFFMTAMVNTKTLVEYLGKRDLGESLKLSSQLSFHWANWDQTCLLLRKRFKNFEQGDELIKLNDEINLLKLKPVWLCNKIKVVKTNLYSLYESYLDSRLRLTWFERKDEILFSLDCEQGPYFTLTSMKWLDHQIYSKFVMRKILLEQYSLRAFRLNCDIPVHVKFDNEINIHLDKAVMHQLSENGFLIKIKDKNFLNKIKNSGYLELKIPIGPYEMITSLDIAKSFEKLNQEGDSKNYKIYKLDSRILNFYGNSTNAKRSSVNEFYLFARYEDLTPIGHENELKKIFKPIVEKTKVLFQRSLLEIEQEKALASVA